MSFVIPLILLASKFSLSFTLPISFLLPIIFSYILWPLYTILSWSIYILRLHIMLIILILIILYHVTDSILDILPSLVILYIVSTKLSNSRS
jgi:phosphoglycerol transferase MdoB-like AlkP superfamily enzyme